MRFSLSRVILAALAFFLPFAVYLKTSSPTVTFIDSGELALVCYTLGIPHPTGYPLYALLGKLVTMLPFGSVIGRLNFLSAIFVAGAVLFLYLSLRKLLLESYKSRKGILLVEMSALFPLVPGDYKRSLQFAYFLCVALDFTDSEVGSDSF